MFASIASSVLSAGASKLLGGGKSKQSRVQRPRFPRTRPESVRGVAQVGTREPRFEEFADLGTAGQVGALISRHDKLMSSIIDLDDKDLKV